MGTSHKEIPFRFDVELDAFEKAGAPAGQERRIGGLVSTDRRDRAGEVVLQDGLDFSLFLTAGWFNDNHDRSTGAIVGYPDPGSLKFIRKGEQLPNGKIAPGNGHWVEGYLRKTKRADEIWELAQDLKGTGRHLGFSVEGGVLERRDNKKTVAKAVVQNVAIAPTPTNPDAQLDVLAKSLYAVERFGIDRVIKALAAGEGVGIPEGPVDGSEAGRVLSREDLGGRVVDQTKPKKRRRRVTKGDLAKAISDRWPQASLQRIGRLVDALWRAA